MDGLDSWRNIVEMALCELTRVPYAHGDIKLETIFDRSGDHYVWINVGWDRGERVLDIMAHIDIIDGKVWIQYDGTQRGIAKDLMAAGIPKDRIVLAFRPVELRKYTEFAVA
jgi:uncharacterized iron-regulated membrane protein